MNTIAERLVFLRGSTTQAEFAERMGINVNTLRAYEKGRALPGFEVLETLCVKLNVSATWILTGRGVVHGESPLALQEKQVNRRPEPSMSPSSVQEVSSERFASLDSPSTPSLVPPLTASVVAQYEAAGCVASAPRVLPDQKQQPVFSRSSEKITPMPTQPPTVSGLPEEAFSPVAEEAPSPVAPEVALEAAPAESVQKEGVSLVMIPMVEARLDAGSDRLRVTGRSERQYAFRRDFVQRKGDAREMVLMRVSGDSMEPEIRDNDVVLLDQSKRDVTAGRLYAVGFDEAVYLKRIDVLPGKMILKSVNPLYAPIEWNTREEGQGRMRILGRVLWCGREYN